MKWLTAYLATAATMILLDLLWIGVIARPLYVRGIGHLMAERPDLVVAAAFYIVYAAGLIVFALGPNESTPGFTRAAVTAALFGLFSYATYDLTNLATLRDWPTGLSLIDIAWGCIASAVATVAGKAVLDRFAAAAA